MRDTELLQLRYFETVARLESMTRAAEYHMVPQSAMSQTVARLEKELGVKLFEREKQRIRLNENGRAFLDTVSSALGILDGGIEKVRKVTGENSIRLHVLQDRNFVNECMVSWSAGNPGTSFAVSYFPEKIHSGEICICDKKTADTYECSEFLFDEEILLGVPSSSPLAQRDEVSLSDAMDYPWIQISDGFPLAELIGGIIDQVPKRFPATIRCQDPHLVKKCVSSGLGVSFMPMALWQENDSFDIRCIRVRDFQLRRSTYICWDRNAGQVAKDFACSVISKSEMERQRGDA